LTNTPKKYIGLKVPNAREEVVKDLEKAGALVKKEVIIHTIGTCYRCGTTIEPKILKQWFIKTKPLTSTALKAIKNSEVRFTSPRYKKTAVH
jgi:valyl-tRNA synthetase